MCFLTLEDVGIAHSDIGDQIAVIGNLTTASLGHALRSCYHDQPHHSAYSSQLTLLGRMVSYHSQMHIFIPFHVEDNTFLRVGPSWLFVVIHPPSTQKTFSRSHAAFLLEGFAEMQQYIGHVQSPASCRVDTLRTHFVCYEHKC